MKENKKYEWNLGLLYKGPKDPQIEKDLITIEKACADFEKKYKGKDFTSSANKLLTALEDHEVLNEKMLGHKPWWYFALQSDIDSGSSFAAASATRTNQRITLATNKLTFFDLAIAAIPKENQKVYLSDKKLKSFSYKLHRIFAGAQYNLSEKEEQLLSMLSQTSYDMWIQGQQRVLSQQTVTHKSKTIPLSKAMNILFDLSKRDRYELSKKINEVLEENSKFAEAEINAVFNYKKQVDALRGFKKPYSSTIFEYENDEEDIEMLVKMVTKYFPLSQKFYSLHAKLLGEKKITMTDRGVKIGSIKTKFDFDSSVSLVRNAFTKFDKKYADLLDLFLENNQIDVFPKKGKTNAAYCSSTGMQPTFVLLNHTDDVRSVEVLAHEMGHAIHTELSKNNPPRYREYSIATAEVASTFFEQLVSDEIEKKLSDEEKIILLHNKIIRDMSTIFRQIACFNYELELHTRIRQEGELNGGTLAEILQKHLQSYTGKSVEVTKEDGYFFVVWPHIRDFFYVYSYAYGQLVSRSLYEKWKTDNSYAEKIEQFLSAGRSMSPKDIFKKIGIDTSDPTFFESGLKAVEADIKKLEKLAKQQGMLR